MLNNIISLDIIYYKNVSLNSNLTNPVVTPATLADGSILYCIKLGNIVTLHYTASGSTVDTTGTIPNGLIGGYIVAAKYSDCSIYVNINRALELKANPWANLIVTYII